MDLAPSPGKIPVVILAGSDRRPGPVPAGAESFHFVVGYKGAELGVGDRCLAQILVERLRASSAFGDIYLAGPARVYGRLVDCRLIDTDGHLGENLKAAFRVVQGRHGRETPVALLSCDVLPQPWEIADLASQLLAPSREESAGRVSGGGTASAGGQAEPAPALVISCVPVENNLGASRWKPKYRFRPAAGMEPALFLPGHLGVARPAMLRMSLLYRLFQLVYEERNRDYEHRRRTIVARILGTLLVRDLWNLLRLEPPTLTYIVLRHGLGTFMSWRRGDLDSEGLAHGLAAVLVRRRYFRRWGGNCVRIVTSPHMSFAKDIDTREELAELVAQLKEL